jgi:ribosome maturation factor RimP
MDETRLTAIQALIEPIVAGQDVELVELTCRPQGRQLSVRLLVDKVGGITIRQCAQLNQRINTALETANLIEESYTVEVSSPGLDRPLVTKRDFERAVGEEVRLDVRIADGRFKETQGMLLAVQPEAIVLKTTAGNVTIPFTDIRIAKKAVKW